MTADLAIRDEQHYLATVSEVRALVERIEFVGDAKSLADKARTLQVWAERARLGQDQVNLAAAARLWAERRAGELLKESLAVGARAGVGRRAAERFLEETISIAPLPTLADLGITKKESHRYQKLADIPEPEFGEALETAAANGRVTAMSVHYSSSTSEWETPQDLFAVLDAEFGFTLDVCATPGNAKCATFFTPATDGLAQEWTGVCWMNPPYGQAISAWVEKAASSPNAETVVCLVPARVDTGWWWDYCRHGEIRFLKGRLKFGGGETGAPFPSAVVVFPRSPRVIWWER